MKDKRIIAMLITSIVTFVASLTISLGVAFALADPVAAVGLAEISYNVSSADSVSQEIVFDPVSAYNEEIKDAILVHNYDNIQYANELLPDNIKLLKVSVTNDTNSTANFSFNITVDGNDGTEKFVKVAVFNADTTSVKEMINGTISQMDPVAPHTVAHYIVAAYVNTEYDFLGEATFGSSMTMKVGITKYEF